MDWVAIDVNIAGDPAVHRIAAVLRVKVPEAVGYLVSAFGGVAQHAQDGDLSQVPDTLLEKWAIWTGKRSAFAAVFREELCNDAGVVTAWERYNGAKIRRLEAARERTRTYREEQARLRELERTQSANGTRTGMRTRTRSSTHTKSVPYARTEQDRTEQNPKSKESGADAPTRKRIKKPGPELPAWAASIAAHWVSRAGTTTTATTVARELGVHVAEHGDAAILRALDGWITARNAGTNASAPRVKYFAEVAGHWVKRTSPSAETPASEPAAVLWARYRRANLLTRWNREEYDRIGKELVDAGEYPELAAFFDELKITQPWTLADARTDAWAIGEISKRLVAGVSR